MRRRQSVPMSIEGLCVLQKYIEDSLPLQHWLLFQYMQEQESIMHVHFPMASFCTEGRSNICIP